MNKGSLETYEASTLVKVLSLLKELERTESGAYIYKHLKALIEEALQVQSQRESSYVTLLNALLERLSEKFVGKDANLQTQIRMIQLCLEPPLLEAEMATLRQNIERIGANLRASESSEVRPAKIPVSLPAPALKFSTSMGSVAVQKREDTSEENTEVDDSVIRIKVDSAYRQHFNQQTREISTIRDSLARHVEEAIAQNEEFGVLLGVELDALREAEHIEDIECRRVSMINELTQFIEKHLALSDKFNSASRYLKLVESNNQQLSDELDRTRLLSLTDELTALPNRRAFLRRLEDEVGRVKRYGTPISMTLIDLDGFKAINDGLGHGGGDMVLRAYSDQILSIFRHHDMVSRYGGEEFAVILPNTSLEGALQALQKVHKRAHECSVTYNGKRFSVPTFSAGLAEYRSGETLGDFVERTDAALYRAKRMGRNRIEIAQDPPESSEDANKSIMTT